MSNGEILTEKVKAIKDGFIHLLAFADGMLHCESDPDKVYVIKDSNVKPIWCPKMSEIVYRIITPDGLMGHAILWPNNQEE